MVTWGGGSTQGLRPEGLQVGGTAAQEGRRRTMGPAGIRGWGRRGTEDTPVKAGGGWGNDPTTAAAWGTQLDPTAHV